MENVEGQTYIGAIRNFVFRFRWLLNQNGGWRRQGQNSLQLIQVNLVFMIYLYCFMRIRSVKVVLWTNNRPPHIHVLIALKIEMSPPHTTHFYIDYGGRGDVPNTGNGEEKSRKAQWGNYLKGACPFLHFFPPPTILSSSIRSPHRLQIRSTVIRECDCSKR